MSELADLIVANSTEAESIVASDYPLGTYEGINVDGLDPLQVAALHSQLVNQNLSGLLGAYEPVAQGSPSGPWLICFPTDFVAALALISPDNQDAIAEQWASSDQLQAAGWTAQDAEAFVARLVRLAQVASFEKKEVFLCAYD